VDEPDEEVSSPESDKLLAKKPPIWKALGRMTKRYVPQVTFLNDLEQESKGQGSPFSKQGGLLAREGTSLEIEESKEVDETMKWDMVKGGVRGVVAEKDALRSTLKKVQTQLLYPEKEIARLEKTHAQHFANYVELSQKLKTGNFSCLY